MQSDPDRTPAPPDRKGDRIGSLLAIGFTILVLMLVTVACNFLVFVR
jgi:hypothetical protein